MGKNQQNYNNIFNGSSIFSTNDMPLFGSKDISIDTADLRRPQKYINDFDSSLILENIDKKSTNKAVRLNLKINTLEKNLNKINEELELIKLLNLPKDAKRKAELIECKRNIELQIEELKRECKNFGIFYSLFAFSDKRIDFKRLKLKFLRLTAEIKRYDKVARLFLLEQTNNMFPFKWWL